MHSSTSPLRYPSDSPSLVNPVLSPMLAHKWVDHKEKLLGYLPTLYCSPKMDGIRCVATRDALYSRNLIQFDSCYHVLEAVREVLGHRTLAGCAFDGELYIHKPSACFERIVTAVKTTMKHATVDDITLQNDVRLHIFDMIDTRFPTRLLYKERLERIQSLLQPYTKDTKFPLCIVPVATFRREHELEARLDTYLDQNFEGVIVRTPNGVYESGKRSKGILKYVPVLEAEFDVFDINEGEGKLSGTVGSFICVTPHGKKFNCNAGVDYAMRAMWWKKRNELVGKKVTVRYQRLTKAGVPRFPQAKSIRNMMKMRV